MFGRLQQSRVWGAVRALRSNTAASFMKQSSRQPWSARKRGVVGLAAVGTCTLAGVTIFGLEVPGLDEGLVRSMRFWRYAGPIYAHYRITERMVQSLPEAEQDKAFEELHEKYAPQIKQLILMLRGFYIKVGQMGATRADFVPQQFIDELETLQDKVPAEDFAHVRETVEKSLGRKLEEVFAWIDEQPLGSASIGQVHRARLHDGREVVVKVKYPLVEQVFESDMATIETFCKIAQPEQLPFLREVRKQFMTEFDYAREARSLQQIADNIEPIFNEVRVPHPLPELCTRDVLVMEYLQGQKLLTAIKDHFRELAQSQGKDFDQLCKEHAAAPPADSWSLRSYMFLIRARRSIANVAITAYNWTLGLLWGPRSYLPPVRFINIPHIMDLLLRVHGHEVLHDGMFNGDPHPGNILLMPDGRLGLIDYGQVKTLSVAHRIPLAKLFVALADGRSDDVCKIHTKMGVVLDRDDKYVLEHLAIIGFDRDDRVTTGGLNLQAFIEHLNSRASIKESADDYVLVARLSVLLRGIGTHIGYPVRTAVAWKQIALDFLKQHNEDPYKI